VPTMETRWWWVRHAPVPDNGRIYGQRDLDCDCSNTAVFDALARELPRDAVWVTSHLARTRQTADAILRAMSAGQSVLRTMPELAEQNLGDWQGLDRAAFLRSRANPHPHWFAAASERAPNGESFSDVIARVSAAMDSLSVEFAEQDIVAVAHGGTIKAALSVALSIDPDSALRHRIDNCSLTRIDRLRSGEWRVAGVNLRPWEAEETGEVRSSPASFA
jgi:alpha-ribazole phosphatase